MVLKNNSPGPVGELVTAPPANRIESLEISGGVGADYFFLNVRM